jgi:hypothetical protein
MKSIGFLFTIVFCFTLNTKAFNGKNGFLPKDSLKKDSVAVKVIQSKDTIARAIVLSDTAKKVAVAPLKNDSVATKQVAEKTGNTYSDGYARISKKNGDVLVATVKSKNLYEVQVIYPLNTVIEKLNTADLNEINYPDGKIDVINNKPEKVDNHEWAVVTSEKDWEKVEVTEDDSKIASLVEKGKVDAKYTGSQTATNQSLEKSGLIIARKRAARLKASVLVISEKQVSRQYGELPLIHIIGTAYGLPD